MPGFHHSVAGLEFSVAVSPFCRCKIPLEAYGSGNGNGNGVAYVRKRLRLTGTAKRQRKNGNGMVETGHKTCSIVARIADAL